MKQVCIALNCPKGGVGKSTLSKELGAAFSMVEINEQKPNICIIDANIDFGDISSMFKIPPMDNMLDFAQDIQEHSGKSYSVEELSKYLVRTNDGIFVLPAPSNTKLNDKLITYATMRVMIETIKQYFDIVIIDTGNNVGDVTIASFEQANQILIVITDESTSINCAVSLFKTFGNIGVNMDKVEIVLNKYAIAKGDRCFSVEEIEEVVGDVFTTISFEERMGQINSSGMPAIYGKETPFKKDIAKLAKKLLPEINEKQLLVVKR